MDRQVRDLRNRLQAREIYFLGSEEKESHSGHVETEKAKFACRINEKPLEIEVMWTTNFIRSADNGFKHLTSRSLTEKEFENLKKGKHQLDTAGAIARINAEDAARAALLPANAPKCPECGRSMVRRSGPYGGFWGCIRYPICKGTRR